MAKSGKTPKGGSSGKKKPPEAARPAPKSAPAPKASEGKPKKPAAASKSASKGSAAKAEAPKPVRVKSPFAPADLAYFKQKLLDRRRRILQSVSSMESEALRAADQDFSVDHMADHGSDNFEQDFTLALVESERRELFEIDQALERLAQGSYGVCEGTNQPIGRARLEAIPYARYSVEYQRRIEAGEVEEEEFRPAMAARERRVPLHEEEGEPGISTEWEKEPTGKGAQREEEEEEERPEQEEEVAPTEEEKFEDIEEIEDEEPEDEEP